MNGMVPDNDVVGHFRFILRRLTSADWAQEWNFLNLTLDIESYCGAGRLYLP
jgi:hypothetical protein